MGNLKPTRPEPKKNFKALVAWLEEYIRKCWGSLGIERFDQLTKVIECVHDEIFSEERAHAIESRKDKFTLKRDWRAIL